jgi:hypothetical protein
LASGPVSTASNKTRATGTCSPRTKTPTWLDNVFPDFHYRQNLIESEFPISIPFLRKTIRPPLSRVNLKSPWLRLAGQARLLLAVLLTLWPVTWLDAGTPHGMMIPQRPADSLASKDRAEVIFLRASQMWPQFGDDHDLVMEGMARVAGR